MQQRAHDLRFGSKSWDFHFIPTNLWKQIWGLSGASHCGWELIRVYWYWCLYWFCLLVSFFIDLFIDSGTSFDFCWAGCSLRASCGEVRVCRLKRMKWENICAALVFIEATLWTVSFSPPWLLLVVSFTWVWHHCFAMWNYPKNTWRHHWKERMRSEGNDSDGSDCKLFSVVLGLIYFPLWWKLFQTECLWLRDSFQSEDVTVCWNQRQVK